MDVRFSEEDLDAAVAADIFPAESVARFRSFIDQRRNLPAADEEQFRLIAGFNDIFVSTGVAMVLAALGWLGFQVKLWLAAVLVAAASWALAEFFTVRRRMALPSILLVLTWLASLIWLGWSALFRAQPGGPKPWHFLVIGLIAGVSAYAHWRRFKTPITVAAGTCAALGAFIAAVSASWSNDPLIYSALIFASGCMLFALALWWDMSDRERRTRRADVAFWLHLAAAPALVHPTFSLLSLSFDQTAAQIGSNVSVLADLWRPALAIGIYVALAIVALIVDRRALMVSALGYLLYALSAILRASGSVSFDLALSALIVGVGLLILSAYWRAARRRALGLAPKALAMRLPAA